MSLRWPQTLDLLVDALSEQLQWEPGPDLGSLAADLELVAQRNAAVLSPPGFELAMHLLTNAARRPDLRERYQRRIVAIGLDHTRQVFVRAQARGEIHPGVDLEPLLLSFVGAIVMATMASPTLTPPDQRERERIVAVTLAACRALGCSCHRTDSAHHDVAAPPRSSWPTPGDSGPK